MLLPSWRRRSTFDTRIAFAYLAGTVTGALSTATLAWLVSGLTEPLPAGALPLLLAVGAALLWLLKEGPLAHRIALPEARRQIPAEVFGDGLARGAWHFGLELGTGLRTYAPAVAPYLALWAVLLLRPTLGQVWLVGLGWGVGRAVPIFVQLSATGDRRISIEIFHSSGKAYPTVAALLVLIGAYCLV